MKFIELLDLKNDYTFKRVFGYTGNEEITKDLLNSILKEEVSKVELNCSTILEKDVIDDKLGILDIRAKINDNIDCDIEMQVVDQNNIEKRILFYLSKMYVQNLKKKENYNRLKKCIAILFTNYDLENIKEIPKYITKWNMREEEYSKIILTEMIEVYIIVMPKVKLHSKNKKLDNWVKFILNSEDVDMSDSNEGIRKAKKVLEEISQDEREQYLAHLREKYIYDQNNILSTGYDRGKEEGIKEGKKQGEKQAKIDIAKKLLKTNMNIKEISNITELTEEELKNINKNQ